MPIAAVQAKASPEFTIAGKVDTKPQMRAPVAGSCCTPQGAGEGGHIFFLSQTLSITGPGDQTGVYTAHHRRSREHLRKSTESRACWLRLESSQKVLCRTEEPPKC